MQSDNEEFLSTKEKNFVRKGVSIKPYQAYYIDEYCIKLSSLVQKAIDKDIKKRKLSIPDLMEKAEEVESNSK